MLKDNKSEVNATMLIIAVNFFILFFFVLKLLRQQSSTGYLNISSYGIFITIVGAIRYSESSETVKNTSEIYL